MSLNIGVNGVSRKASGIFVGDASGIARKVVKAYIGDTNGIARQFYSSSSKLGELAVGSSVYMNVGGERKEFIVVHQGIPSTTKYDSTCNGTWLLMKTVYGNNISWGSSNDFATSNVHSYLNNDFINLLDTGVSSKIKTVNIPYAAGDNTPLTTSAKIFIPSTTEVNISNANYTYAISAGEILEYFLLADNSKRIAYDASGSAKQWWTRCPASLHPQTSYLTYIQTSGGANSVSISNTMSKLFARPMMIFPTDMLVNGDGDIII